MGHGTYHWTDFSVKAVAKKSWKFNNHLPNNFFTNAYCTKKPNLPQS
jgi:hypothetical protein